MSARQSEDQCPECGSSLQGEPIPKRLQRITGGATRYRREGGMEVRGVYDGVLFWFCPDCSFAWPRWFGIHQRDELSIRYASDHNAERKAMRVAS